MHARWKGRRTGTHPRAFQTLAACRLCSLGPEDTDDNLRWRKELMIGEPGALTHHRRKRFVLEMPKTCRKASLFSLLMTFLWLQKQYFIIIEYWENIERYKENKNDQESCSPDRATLSIWYFDVYSISYPAIYTYTLLYM